MKILHYTLGMPPFRSGGLTKYSLDIMYTEICLGNEVYLLYPGEFSINKRTKIKKNTPKHGIKVYEIINPLPVSLLGGISDCNKFTININKEVYEKFLSEVKPDIIHIHTLMGLHREFLDVAKELNIKIIYTTHDYFGICPKVNLIDFKGEVCSDYNYGQRCLKCNYNSYSMIMIYIMQSKLYRLLKNNSVVKKIRTFKKNNIKSSNIISSDELDKIYLKNNDDYIKLRKYYLSMLEIMDYIHFNSTVAKEIYSNYINNLKGEVISITHSDIKISNRAKTHFNKSDKLRISYLGPMEKYKGFYLLKESLDKLLEDGINNWKLNTYGDDSKIFTNNDNYENHGKYLYEDLSKIFENTDVVVVPSIWKETFGFIGLEALSHRVPVIISDNAGVKDVIKHYKTGIIFSPNVKNLSRLIENLVKDRKVLEEIQININELEFDFTIQKHTKDIIDLYERVISERAVMKC